jgi:uncharacterized protein with FMN-binding domain
MSRKTRQVVANSVIAGLALAGAVVVTNHFAPSTSTTSTTSTSSGTSANTASTSSSGSSSSSGTTTATGKSGTATSDAIPYQFGQVQLSVTKVNGKITAIDYSNSTATNGRDQAFPYLVQYAIQAQGTNFSNLSGATYTTDAFKQALSSAVSKLG